MMTASEHEGRSVPPEATESVAADFVPPNRSNSTSAPPVLELATESLFAFNPTVQYANIFSDIRAHEEYYEYYNQNKQQKKLPPPLDPAPFLYQDDEMSDMEGHRYFNNFSSNGTSSDSLIMEARRQLQDLQLDGQSSSGDNRDVWSPLPTRRLVSPVDFSEDAVRDRRRDHEHQEINFASSPSAQAAFRSAAFIWKDEEPSQNAMSYSQPFAAPSVHSPGLVASALENSLAQNTFFGHTRNPSHSSTSPPPSTENEQENGVRSSVICRYYAGGYCSRGDKCFYSHDTDSQEKARNDAKIKTPTKAKPFKNGKANPISPRNNGATSAVVAPAAAPPAAGVPPEQYYTNFDQLVGKIYSVSRDQQGCRFLQKKLEEKEPPVVEAIFNEVYDHITDLMTDPFGNYLCQKLLEFSNDEQRLAIVKRVSPNLVVISKNMHGTRAVQKMIECLSTPSQIKIIINVLSHSVVELIQDLNGNHVIQRCLNKLSPQDNQFIYDAVTSDDNCVQVATHRHGCCVLQRCIDHASANQKVQLIQEITNNALILVQDPYGNYVVQYVLELPFPHLVNTLAGGFLGHLRPLAMQKFSSNVIEKCLALAQPDTREAMIHEVLQEENLSAMLQDPFANYVVQTALTVSDQPQHIELVEAIKPHLPQLRNTPYGKRIQSKIAKETSERSTKNKGRA